MAKRSEFVEHVVETMRAFGPVEAKDGRKIAMSYRCAPDEAIENPDVMAVWARYGYEAALRAAAAKAKPAKVASLPRSPARSRRGS